MTTTGELSAIIQDLDLVDAGDAASYLGEGWLMEEDVLDTQPVLDVQFLTSSEMVS